MISIKELLKDVDESVKKIKSKNPQVSHEEFNEIVSICKEINDLRKEVKKIQNKNLKELDIE